MTPKEWNRAKSELSAADSVMAGIIAAYPAGERLESRGEAFYTMARSIVGQQVSVKAAESIWGRVEALCLSPPSLATLGSPPLRGEIKRGVQPQVVLGLDAENLCQCGLSRQKVLYLGEIARFFVENKADEAWFAGLSDEEVLKALVSIKGVGKWTAEMFLMFHLQRPDVFPVDDIGIQKAIERHYGLEKPTVKKEYYKQLQLLAENWWPWRTVASWYLWRSLDPVPVAY